MDHTPPSEPTLPTDIRCVFTKYAMRTPAARMLVHGVGVQMLAVLMSFVWGFFVDKDAQAGLTMEPLQRMLRPTELLGLLSSLINLAGWAMVIFACGKVVAEAVKGEGEAQKP